MSKLNLLKTENLGQLGEYLNGNTLNAKISEIALTLVAVTTVVGVAVVAVGIGNAVQLFDTRRATKKYSQKQRLSAFYNLYRQKLIYDKNGQICLTNKGEGKLFRFYLNNLSIPKPKQWDKRWRMVLFDIPAEKRKTRDALRFTLHKLGFVQFQKSAWLYPFPCEKEINFIIDYFNINKHVEILTITSITNESKFKKLFKL